MDISKIVKLTEQCVKEHTEQRRLFEYQNSRKLPRPKTTRLDVALLIVAYLALLAVCVVLNVTVSAAYYLEIPVSIAAYGLITEFSLRVIGIKIVECYQHYASEKTRRKCLCVPSCSEYAVASFKRYELILALIKIRKRLTVTCKGERYIIDPPYKNWEMPPLLK